MDEAFFQVSENFLQSIYALIWSTGENKTPNLKLSLDLMRTIDDRWVSLFCLCDYSLQCCDYYSIIGFQYWKTPFKVEPR